MLSGRKTRKESGDYQFTSNAVVWDFSKTDCKRFQSQQNAICPEQADPVVTST